MRNLYPLHRLGIFFMVLVISVSINLSSAQTGCGGNGGGQHFCCYDLGGPCDGTAGPESCEDQGNGSYGHRTGNAEWCQWCSGGAGNWCFWIDWHDPAPGCDPSSCSHGSPEPTPTPTPQPTCGGAVSLPDPITALNAPVTIRVTGVSNATQITARVWDDPTGSGNPSQPDGVATISNFTNMGGGTWEATYTPVNLTPNTVVNEYGPIRTDVYLNNSAHSNIFCDSADYTYQAPPILPPTGSITSSSHFINWNPWGNVVLSYGTSPNHTVQFSFTGTKGNSPTSSNVGRVQAFMREYDGNTGAWLGNAQLLGQNTSCNGATCTYNTSINFTNEAAAQYFWVYMIAVDTVAVANPNPATYAQHACASTPFGSPITPSWPPQPGFPYSDCTNVARVRVNVNPIPLNNREISGPTRIVTNTSTCASAGTLSSSSASFNANYTYNGGGSVTNNTIPWNSGTYRLYSVRVPSGSSVTGSLCFPGSLTLPGQSDRVYNLACARSSTGTVYSLSSGSNCINNFQVNNNVTNFAVGYTETLISNVGWWKGIDADVYGAAIGNAILSSTNDFMADLSGTTSSGPSSVAIARSYAISSDSKIAQSFKYMDGFDGNMVDPDISFTPNPDDIESDLSSSGLTGLQSGRMYTISLSALNSWLQSNRNYTVGGPNGVAVVYVTTSSGTPHTQELIFPSNLRTAGSSRVLFITPTSVRYRNVVGSTPILFGGSDTTPHIQAGVISGGTIEFESYNNGSGEVVQDLQINVEGPVVAASNTSGVDNSIYMSRNLLPSHNPTLPAETVRFIPNFYTYMRDIQPLLKYDVTWVIEE